MAAFLVGIQTIQAPAFGMQTWLRLENPSLIIIDTWFCYKPTWIIAPSLILDFPKKNHMNNCGDLPLLTIIPLGVLVWGSSVWKMLRHYGSFSVAEVVCHGWPFLLAFHAILPWASKRLDELNFVVVACVNPGFCRRLQVFPKELLPDSSFHFIYAHTHTHISHILCIYINFIYINFIYITYIIYKCKLHLHHIHHLQVWTSSTSYTLSRSPTSLLTISFTSPTSYIQTSSSSHTPSVRLRKLYPRYTCNLHHFWHRRCCTGS